MVNLKEELAVANAASHNLQLKLDQMTEENQSLVSRLRDSEDKILVAEGEKEEVDTHWRKMSKEVHTYICRDCISATLDLVHMCSACVL